MAFDLTWYVYYSDVTGYTEITDYVTDLYVDLSCPLGVGGRTMARITINNDGGQFTPGGSGTYANIDWFSKALEIHASADGNTYYVFSGLIQAFDVEQISKQQSTVIVNALDFLSVGGRSSSSPPTAAILVGDGLTMIAEFFNSGGTYFPNVVTPTMGSTTGLESNVAGQSVTDPAYATAISSAQLSAGRIGDWINNNVMTTAPAAVWSIYSAITSDRWFWNFLYLDRTLNREITPKNFYLWDKSVTITTGVIPITDIEVGYTIETLTNTTTVQDADASYSAVTTTNSTSSGKYGPRARAYLATAPDVAASVTNCSNFWTNRYSTVRYIPQSVSVTYSTLKANAVNDDAALTAFAELLDPLYNVWNRINIKYKGPGMSSTSEVWMVADGVQIAATPYDTRITLRLQSGIDNQSFELNSSTFGILDTNRLG